MDERVDLIVFTFYFICLVFWFAVFAGIFYLLKRLGVLQAISAVLGPPVLVAGVIFAYFMMALIPLLTVPDSMVTMVKLFILVTFIPAVWISFQAYKFGARLANVPDESPVVFARERTNDSKVHSAETSLGDDHDNGQPENHEETAASLFEDAKKHLAEGQKKRAIAVLRHIVSEYPETSAGRRAKTSLTRKPKATR